MMNDRYNPEKHINYVHLVGKINSISYINPTNSSPHAIINLEICTEYKGKNHPPLFVQVIAWDRLSKLLSTNDIYENDIIHVEGRLTIREKDGKTHYGVTGNRISVVRKIENKDAFLQKLEY